MKIESPTADRVLIKADKPKNKTETGLLIVEEWKTLPHTGVVMAIGPQVEYVKVGDTVLFERYASVILEDDLRLCNESHILASIS